MVALLFDKGFALCLKMALLLVSNDASASFKDPRSPAAGCLACGAQWWFVMTWLRRVWRSGHVALRAFHASHTASKEHLNTASNVIAQRIGQNSHNHYTWRVQKWRPLYPT
jgi:hypothetical protein